MNARAITTHFGVAVLAFALGYAVFSARKEGESAIRHSDDPTAEFAEIVQIQDAHARAKALLDFFASADPAWAERLRAEVDPQASEIVLDEIGEILFASWWARSNPEAAFENRIDPAWRNRNPWLREVMIAWSAKDPAQAAVAANTLPPNPDRGVVEAVRILVDHWWDKPESANPTPLVDLIRKLEVVPRAGAIQRLIELSMKHRGVEETEKFVESLPEEEDIGVSVQSEMLARFGQALLDYDKPHAIRWANKHGRGRKGSGVLRHLAFSWGKENGPEAMDWAMKLEDETQRPAIIYRVWLSFRQEKPEEAAQWLLAQGPTPILEGVYARYLTGLGMDKKPTEGFEIAERADDDLLRERLRTAVALGWAQSDPEATTKWLETAKLAPDLDARVRKVMQAKPAQPMVLSDPNAG